MSGPVSAVAGLVVTVLVGLSAVHLYWVAGGRAGASAAVPARPEAGGVPLFRPRPLGTLAVAVALAATAAAVLGRAALVPALGPPGLARATLWLAASAFGLRAVGDFRYVGAFKRVRGTRFAALDTWLYTPLCAALSASTFWLAAT